MFAKQDLFAKYRDTQAERKTGPVGGSGGTGYPSSAQAKGQHTPPEANAAGADAAQGTATAATVAKTMPGNDELSGTHNRLIVGPDVKLKGAEILDCDTLVVEGRVEATMDSRVIRIAEHGSFAGKVGIDIAEIHGLFEGELTTRQQLVIHATGRVSGTIRYGKLLIEEGGEISGDVKSLGSNQIDASHKAIPGRQIEVLSDAHR